MRPRVGPWANAKDRAVDGDVVREVQALGITSDDLPPVRGIGFVSAREMPHDIGEDAVLGTDTPAVRAANKEDQVKIVGFDNISAVQGMIRDGAILATADQHGDQLAVFGIEAALAALEGGEAPADKKTPVDLVTKESL